jgi:hypothetical protein
MLSSSCGCFGTPKFYGPDRQPAAGGKGLVREADVFSQGYRPGALGNRGLHRLAPVRALLYRLVSTSMPIATLP